MAHPEFLKEVMKELSAVEFLKITLMKLQDNLLDLNMQKMQVKVLNQCSRNKTVPHRNNMGWGNLLDEITIKTEEELLLLDKVLYKSSNISKDFKMRLLSPQLQEKFNQRMKEIKLDQSNFVNMLKAHEKGKGPYNKPKPDIPLNLPADNPVPKPVPEGPQIPYKTETLPEKTTIAPSPDKRQPAYSNTRRPNEKGSMTPKRARSSSSSSSSDSDEKEGLQVKISKLQNEIARLNAAKASEESEQNARASAKYSFSLKKPEGSGRTVLMHGSSKDDPYFERSSRAHEPRSERGERSDYRDPDMYSPQRSEGRGKWEEKKIYRSKTYRPPYPFKR